MVTVVLHPKKEFRIQSGHNWIFSNEIARVEPKNTPIEAGTIVQVHNSMGVLIGTGFYHPNALIAVRMMTRGQQLFSSEIIINRIKAAAARREKLLPGVTLRRLVFSDSDDLSGLIIDQFGEAVSVQIHSAGMEREIPAITTALKAIGIKAAWLRNDTNLRTLEGLESTGKDLLFNEVGNNQFPVEENGIKYEVDPAEGQKTGFYIDQRENRRVFQQLVKKDFKVLDAFCNEGGFALAAAIKGAHVTAVDISQGVLGRAEINAKKNNLQDNIQFVCADVMKWLPAQSNELFYDIINLDPPNFAHNRKSAPVAMHAYQKLHEGALKRLKPGGFLITSSCSHHIDETMFMESVERALFRTNSRLNLIYKGWQPPDHPVRIGMPETYYLKCFMFEKI